MSTAPHSDARRRYAFSPELPPMLDDVQTVVSSLPPAAVLPEQFYDPIPAPAPLHGVLALMHAVLDNALWCWRRQFTAKSRREQRLAREADEWFFSDDVSWPFSFVNICAALGMEPNSVRQGLRRWRQHPPVVASRAKGRPVFASRWRKLAA